MIAGALAVAAPVALVAIYHPERAISIGTGAVADALCAKAFVSGLDPQASFAEILTRPGIRLLRRGLRYRLDRTARTVDVSVVGLFATHVAFHEGLGCVRVQGGREPYLPRTDFQALKTPKAPPLLPDIAGSEIVEPSDPALKAALDHAFEERAKPPFRRTKAVVVVRDGRVIAERYASGVGIDAAAELLDDEIGHQRAARHHDATGPHLAVTAGTDPGVAWRRRSQARDRGRTSHAHDVWPCAR